MNTNYTTIPEIDLIVLNLKNFFFEKGKNNNCFLIPENEYDKGITEFNNLIDIISEIISHGLKLPYLINNLKILNQSKRKRINMAEDYKENEISTENYNNEVQKGDNAMKSLQETLKYMQTKINENDKKFYLQKELIENLKIQLNNSEIENKKKIEELNNSEIENKKK